MQIDPKKSNAQFRRWSRGRLACSVLIASILSGLGLFLFAIDSSRGLFTSRGEAGDLAFYLLLPSSCLPFDPAFNWVIQIPVFYGLLSLVAKGWRSTPRLDGRGEKSNF